MCACLWLSMCPLLPSSDAMKPLKGRKASLQASIEPGGEWWLGDGSQILVIPLVEFLAFRSEVVFWLGIRKFLLPLYKQGFTEQFCSVLGGGVCMPMDIDVSSPAFF